MKILFITFLFTFSFVSIIPAIHYSYQTAQQISGDYANGYRAGYHKANPMGICPIPPIPEIGRNTYEDGFVDGYNRGISDKF